MKRYAGLILAAMTAGLPMTALAEDIRIAVRTETSSVDPHFSSSVVNIEMVLHIFEPLIKFDPEMKLIPGLATSWRALDDKTWEFKLRAGVKWHDGTPFTADDVIFTWSRLPELSFAADPFVQYISDKKIEKIDDLTLKITTAAPNPIVPQQMTQVFIISRKNGTGMKPEDYNSGKAAIGTGPYKIVEYVKGDRFVLKGNADWWAGKPKWDNVTIKPIASGPSRVAALRSGQVDFINNVPTEDVAQLKNDRNVKILSGPTHRPLFLHLDSNRDLSPNVFANDGKPLWPNPFRDWRVRKAFAKAIDRVAIVDRIMEGNAVPATQLLPPGFFGHNADLKVEAPDVAGANKLMVDAGYPDGFRIKLHSTNDRYVNDTKIIQAIAQMLAQIGVKSEVITLPIAVYFGRQQASNEYSTWLGAYNVATGEPSTQLNSLLHTTIPNSRYCCIPRGYSNPRLDVMLEKANVTMDDAEREKLYKEVIAIGINDVALIPLHFQMNIWGAKPTLTYTNRMDEMTQAENIGKAN